MMVVVVVAAAVVVVVVLPLAVVALEHAEANQPYQNKNKNP